MMALSSYEKYSRLAQVICCPLCKADVTFENGLWCGQVIVNAEILCKNCGKCGTACNTKLIFNDNPSVNLGTKGVITGTLTSSRLDEFIHNLSLHGDWHSESGRCWSSQAGAELRFDTTAIGVDLRLLKHSWGGRAAVKVDDDIVYEVDLHEPAGSMELSLPIALDGRQHSITIYVTGTCAEESHACQVFFCGYDELRLTPSKNCDFIQFSGNLGNPYPSRWPSLVVACNSGDLILDCGAGDRRYPDNRVINFEYTPFALPDVFGDAHNLPFKDKSFGLILSQAVIEHLYDPFAAVKEIYRVSSVGAITLAESAFMQPLHAVPFHFFNTTKWGMEKLFEDFSIINVDSVGNLSQTLSWIYSLVELPEEQNMQVKEIINLASKVDMFISDKELEKFASFIRLEAYRA